MKYYKDEKAIISLTTWKARIGTVHKTIYSLLHKCPGFHIVLVLSSDEFTNGIKDLPFEIHELTRKNLIEILWVKKNYKVFKKILFTMDKYRNVPVISADDDCLYKFNYAQALLDEWEKSDKQSIITLCKNQNIFDYNEEYKGITRPVGPCSLYHYQLCKDMINHLSDESILATNNDDSFYGICAYLNGIKIKFGNYKLSDVLSFHDEIEATTTKISNKQEKYYQDKRTIFERMLIRKSIQNKIIISNNCAGLILENSIIWNLIILLLGLQFWLKT